ncbi:MAG: ATP-binding cassette domain-containing protein [Bacilli bacterium]
MLVLKEIVKNYVVAGQPFPALRGVDLSFRNDEFVSILGPSGCGKTTMMNIIGGLDRYTSGDLIVDGKSTKNFTESEWDSYRNATIGFVFQTYNLISHLSVLDNVEMSLRLSGVGAAERRKRALDVLIEVGLKDHVYKRPNQLSGGQMQRVAIARALVNNPKILLADEPTGALDTNTSGQILELIKKIAKGRLVIMVTHNAELAQAHSDRIVKLLDGRVVDDSRPEMVDTGTSGKLMTKRTTMPFTTALKTSANNLLTKKGRTIITSLAGSIGIIGIALVLSISEGMNTYVGTLQSDTLAGFPITITPTIRQFGPPDTANPSEFDFPDTTVVTEYNSRPDEHTNNISQEFVDYLEAMPSQYYNALTYSRAMAMRLVSRTSGGGYKLLSSTGGGTFAFARTFYEMPNNIDFIAGQYDVLAGRLPDLTQTNEMVLVVDVRNRIDQGLFDDYGLDIGAGLNFETIVGENSPFNVKWIPNDVLFQQGTLGDKTRFSIPFNQEQAMFDNPKALALNIVGILRVKPSASAEVLSPGIAYSPALTSYAFADEEVGALNSEIVQAQVDIWENHDNPYLVTGTLNEFESEADYQLALKSIGGSTLPVGVQIYPSTFDNKDLIKAYIDAFNYLEDETRKPIEEVIIYTDLAENITSTITELINTIAIVLSAFASISLVVSSIMIGIITYVSVIERTKEIGIMRSLGARKKDIARIFNAETIIIGFVSGVFGIVITLILSIPIDLIILDLIEVANFTSLSPIYAIGLISLSTILTLLAGLIPSGIAARKDPVIALRTE